MNANVKHPKIGDIVVNRSAGELSENRVGFLVEIAGRSGETGIFLVDYWKGKAR